MNTGGDTVDLSRVLVATTRLTTCRSGPSTNLRSGREKVAMPNRIRPLVIRTSESRLYELRADYEYRLGYACRLTPGQLVVYPRLNSVNLTKN